MTKSTSRGRWWLGAVGAFTIGAVAVAQGATAGSCPVTSGVVPKDPSSASCLSCHMSSGASSATQLRMPGGHSIGHPVDLDYASAQAARVGGASGLREQHEVVKRGVFLPQGKIECLTCHDPHSRWRYHLAIPSGAKVTRYVELADKATYGDPLERDTASTKPLVSTRERLAVSPKPLCLACHSMD